MSFARRVSVGPVARLLTLVALTLFSGLAVAEVVVQLPGQGGDFVLDVARDFIYVSVPAEDIVVRISASNYNIFDSIDVGEAPRGLELGPDGDTLYAALNSSGEVAVFDLPTETV